MDGIGLSPSPQNPTTITSQLHSNAMAVVTFTNPLSQEASFDINLKAQHDLFCLFLKQLRGVILQAGVSLDIPVMFAPDTMKMSYAELIISADEGLEGNTPFEWVYPIHGLPEKLVKCSVKDCGMIIKGRAKERTENTVEVNLNVLKNEFDGSRNNNMDDDSLEELDLTLREKYVFDFVPDQDIYKEQQRSLKEFIGLQLVSEHSAARVATGCEDVKLMFRIVFLPPKSLK